MTKNKIEIIAFFAAFSLLVMLFISYWCKSHPTLHLFLAMLIVIFEVIVPVEILRHHHLSLRSFNIYAYHLETIPDLLFPPFLKRKIKPDVVGLLKELPSLLSFSLIVFIPYLFLYWGFQTLLALRGHHQLIFSFNLPPKFFYEFLTQIFVVALPEEMFYRGFLQSALLKRWPHSRFFLGIPGPAILITNAIFALGHVASTLSPSRLLTFFPGLLFSYLVYKNKSLLSAILFHATCNIIGQILYNSFFLD